MLWCFVTVLSNLFPITTIPQTIAPSPITAIFIAKRALTNTTDILLDGNIRTQFYWSELSFVQFLYVLDELL